MRVTSYHCIDQRNKYGALYIALRLVYFKAPLYYVSRVLNLELTHLWSSVPLSTYLIAIDYQIE